MDKEQNQHGFFSKKLRAGKRRTYFFDVRSTKQGDYFLTITESKRRFDKGGYDSHKVFLYKEDFKNFVDSLNETLDYIKTELNPEFDYDNYDREVYRQQVAEELENSEQAEPQPEINTPTKTEKNNLYANVKEQEPEVAKAEIESSTPNDDEAMEW